MSNILTITTCGIDTESEIQGNAAIVYNGSTLYALTAGETKTLKTANTRCATDISIGNKTLQCGGMVMTSDVVCNLREKPTPVTITITGSGNNDFNRVEIPSGSGNWCGLGTYTVTLGTNITWWAKGSSVIYKGRITHNGNTVAESSSSEGCSYTMPVNSNVTATFDYTNSMLGGKYGRTVINGGT